MTLVAGALKVMYWMDLSRRLLHVCNCRTESALCRLNFGIVTKIIQADMKNDVYVESGMLLHVLVDMRI